MNIVQQDTVKPNIWVLDDVMPQFPGGDSALIKWLYTNIQYPKEAVEKGIQGRVTIRFVITSDGSVENAVVQKSLDSACDEEALRVVKMMPKWIPEERSGEPRPVYYSLPVTFKLPISDVSNTTDSVQHIPVIAQYIHYSKDSTQIIYKKVEIMPQFPGGDVALMKFLMKNVTYPGEAAVQGIQGRVFVGFIVAPDGSIADVKVEKSVNPILDAEAIRVAKMMPKWIPGKQNGNPVYVYYTVPVVFWLGTR